MDCVYGIVVAVVLFLEYGTASTPNNVQDFIEYCEWESFNATCERDEVIIMRNAKYGRMRLGKCVTKNYGHIGCGTDVMPFMEERCSGRQRCVTSVISLHSKRSCPKDFKSYLQAGYDCVKVAYKQQECLTHGFANISGASSGVIGNAITMTSRSGSPCPWVVEVEPYQRINLTLVDFSKPVIPGFHSYERDFVPSIKCEDEYAVIVDSHGSRNVSLCARQHRQANVYVSRTNKIQIHILQRPQSTPNPVYFLLRYEAVGCPPISPPATAWVSSDGEHAIIQCNETEEAWFLTCVGTEWSGNLGNCSQSNVAAADWTISGMFQGVTSFPFGLLIVVALGVAIGVAIGLVMLVTVLAYMKRRRRRKVRSRSSYLLKTMSQENAENQSKLNLDNAHDSSPMLVKRASSLPSQTRDYSSWQRCRPLPPTKVTAAESREESDYTPDGKTYAHRHTLPRLSMPKVFTTFKPPEHSEDCGHSPPERVEYVIRTCDEGPYYFKLNPNDPNGPTRDTESVDGLKPDLLPGCIECQERMECRPRHSVV